GAECDSVPVAPSGCTALSDAIVGLAGLPGGSLGARQSRAFGAAALDLCYVAAGRLDGYLPCTAAPQHGPWDYLGALLVCREAGAVMADRFGKDLETVEWEARRSPVGAATPSLLAQLLQVPAATAWSTPRSARSAKRWGSRSVSTAGPGWSSMPLPGVSTWCSPHTCLTQATPSASSLRRPRCWRSRGSTPASCRSCTRR